MPSPERSAELLPLLQQLGAEDDRAALEAARELHRRVVLEGDGWESLIDPQFESPTESPLNEGAEGEGEAAPVAASEDDLAILERLLLRTDISEETRQELEGLRADIQNGSFSAMDAQYLRALDARLERA